MLATVLPHVSSLRDVSLEGLSGFAAATFRSSLQALSPRRERECARQRSRAALRRVDLRIFGELLNQSHRSCVTIMI